MIKNLFARFSISLLIFILAGSASATTADFDVVCFQQ